MEAEQTIGFHMTQDPISEDDAIPAMAKDSLYGVLSTSSAEASRSRAKTSPSLANALASSASAPASSSSSHESLTLFSQPEDGSSLRTYPDSFPRTVAEISESYSRRWPSSGF